MRSLSRLRSVRWWYPRPLTTLAVAVVALVTALLARAALPDGWRPASPLWVLPAAAAGYVALVVGSHKGWTKRFKHGVLDPIGGNVDDATPWLLGTLTGAAFLVVVALVARATG